MKAAEVFGISPAVREHSYVDRGELDEALAKQLARTTHLAIRGPSKSGKSWLRQKALHNPITVQCRLGKPFTEIYVDALSQLEVKVEVKESRQGVFKAQLSAQGELGAALLAKAGFSAGISKDRTEAMELSTVGHDVNDLRFVADLINKSERRLVIEDFHYMSPEDRTGFAFDLKALWDYETFVIIIGVWSESNLILHLNPDLTGRVYEVSLEWVKHDLETILVKGGKALNLEFTPEVMANLCEVSYSNAGLLQQLALFTLDEAEIIEGSLFRKQQVAEKVLVESACMIYAEQLNATYQQFAKRVATGIRTRKKATGIYAHAMAAIMSASDEDLIGGLHARKIFESAHK